MSSAIMSTAAHFGVEEMLRCRCRCCLKQARVWRTMQHPVSRPRDAGGQLSPYFATCIQHSTGYT